MEITLLAGRRATLVRGLGKKGVPVVQVKTDITDDGRFAVDFALDTPSLLPAARSSKAIAAMRTVFQQEARLTSVWRQPNPLHLRLVTTQSYDFLKGLKEPSDTYLKQIGVQQNQLGQAELKLLAAAERLESQEGLA